MDRTTVRTIIAVIVVLLGDGFVWLDLNYGESEGFERKKRAITNVQHATAVSPPETFERLCNETRYARSTKKGTNGPIWIYGAGRNFSPVYLGKSAHAASEQEARTLVCVFEEDRVIEPCRYLGGYALRREVVDTYVTLVNIQGAAKVADKLFSGSTPDCPSGVSSLPPLVVGSGPKGEEILSWVQKHWSP